MSDFFMCCICFDSFPLEEAHVDIIGQRWNMCDPCDQAEKALVAAKDALAEGGLLFQPGPKDGPSDSESLSPDSTLNI